MDSHRMRIDSRPSEYEYAKLSNHVYNLPVEGEFVPDFPSWKVMQSWHGEEGRQRVPRNRQRQETSLAQITTSFVARAGKRITKFMGYVERQLDFGFAAAIYLNEEQKQIVLAYRGTADLMGWYTDLTSVVGGLITPQLPLAHEATEAAVRLAKERGYSLHMTGHSLGAWLAELSLFFSLLEFDHYASAVTFESPGAWSMIKGQLLSLLPETQADDLEALRNFADLTTLRSYPNPINTCDVAFGTVKALYPLVADKSRLPLIYIAEAHSMTHIVEGYERLDPIQPIIMADWPLWSDLRNYYQVSDFTDGQWLVDEEKYTAFDRYYRAHYKAHTSLNDAKQLHLRHFHPDVRGLLLQLQERLQLDKLTPSRRDKLQNQLISQLGFSEAQASLVVSYQIQHRIVSVNGTLTQTAEDFRCNISQLFQSQFEQIETLLFQEDFLQSATVVPIFADSQTAEGDARIDNILVGAKGTMVEGDASYTAAIHKVDREARQAEKEDGAAAKPDLDRPFAITQEAKDNAMINNRLVIGFFAKQSEQKPAAVGSALGKK